LAKNRQLFGENNFLPPTTTVRQMDAIASLVKQTNEKQPSWVGFGARNHGNETEFLPNRYSLISK
jgi:hypothetical protein